MLRYRPPAGVDADALNQRILDRFRAETGLAPSSTLVDGGYAIRPCFVDPRTTEREVEALVAAVVRFGDGFAG